jgi:serine/threonine-protein kinase
MDGTRLLLFENVGGGQDIASFALQRAPTAPGTNQGRTAPIVHTTAAELNPELSPDGRWLAYQSNRSGQFEIYVSPFPNVDGGLWPVSQGGGTRPVWARNGRALFYLDAKNLLTVVPVQTSGAAFAAGNQVRILATAYYPGFTTLGLDLRGYDVSPDGQRFLMIKESDASSQTSTSPSASLVVVLNWLEELKTKLK